MKIGMKLKKLRLKKKYSLEKLAKKVGFTRSFLSQIELNKTAPSIASLMKILKVLDVRMDEFFQEKPQKKEIVLRKEDRKIISFQESKLMIEMLSPPSYNSIMEPAYVELEKGCDSDLLYTKGEIFCTILKGTVEVTVGNKKYVLHKGDSIWLDGLAPHRWKNPGRQKATGIWVRTQRDPDQF